MSKLYILYLAAFVTANLIVKHFGPYGLWFSSFTLIPFDFVSRCIIHEKYKGWNLIFILFSLVVGAAVITIFINFTAMAIAIASILGFTTAQVIAGTIYQIFKNRKYFFKVNLSDLAAIIFDSIIFQWVSFGSFAAGVTIGQVLIKFAGGLLWYYILFHKLKIQQWKI